MELGTLIGLAVAAVLLLLVLQRARRGDAPKAEVPARSEVDGWIEEAVARDLGKRIALGYAPLLEALRGDPSPDAVTAMEDAVRNVKVTYAKMADGEVEVRAEIAFEDGTSASGSKRFSKAQLPAPIGEEFLRTGGAYVYRDWHFPWYGPERGWASF
jgi:hypothetical protein